MNKSLRELHVYTEKGEVNIEQPEEDSNLYQKIIITENQIDILIDWLNEAKKELNNEE